MLQFDIDVKTGIRLREVTLNDAPMIYRAIASIVFPGGRKKFYFCDRMSRRVLWIGRVCEFRFCQSSYRNRLLAVARISATRNNDPKCSDTLSMGCGSTFDASHSSNAIPRRLGFRLEGTERDGELMFSGEYVDTNVYSILDSEIISWSGKNI